MFCQLCKRFYEVKFKLRNILNVKYLQDDFSRRIYINTCIYYAFKINVNSSKYTTLNIFLLHEIKSFEVQTCGENQDVLC